VALVHVDDPVRFFRVEADDRDLPDLQRFQRRAPPRTRRRQMRFANIGFEGVLGERGFDPRDEIAAVGGIVGMLQLAPAAFREMPARRFLVVGPKRQRAIVENGIAGDPERNVPATGRHPVAASRDPDDKLVHKRSSAAGSATTRSSAIM